MTACPCFARPLTSIPASRRRLARRQPSPHVVAENVSARDVPEEFEEAVHSVVVPGLHGAGQRLRHTGWYDAPWRAPRHAGGPSLVPFGEEEVARAVERVLLRFAGIDVIIDGAGVRVRGPIAGSRALVLEAPWRR